MTAEFLKETETDSSRHCCVCNRTYEEKEIGWVYNSEYGVLTCSNECYTSEKHKMLLSETPLRYQNKPGPGVLP